MIEISVGKHFRENREKKHKRDAKNGWYRYDSRFALPVYDDKGELERYNIFHASMLVRHSNDGKLYLYDVIDIKKKRATLSANNRLPDKNPFPLKKDNTMVQEKCQSNIRIKGNMSYVLIRVTQFKFSIRMRISYHPSVYLEPLHSN